MLWGDLILPHSCDEHRNEERVFANVAASRFSIQRGNKQRFMGRFLVNQMHHLVAFRAQLRQ
ncbi:hypothetical protein DSM25559_4775 [Agrobacterium rosae]|uniref:Uncharacterized protein n=1 Tax=Agrobacterium rosae TaxID=1972867 RepID=A0A1R3U8E8_9HYPH|nr:hypothetical protein DSM25559_4775 [Agrobacterium rosae]